MTEIRSTKPARRSPPRLAALFIWTLGAATLLSIWVLLVTGFRPARYIDEYHLTVAAICGWYYAVALAVAPLLRLLWPLTRQGIGAYLVGAVAGTVGYGLIGFSQDGWTPGLPWFALALGFTVGGAVGVHFYRRARARDRAA